MGQSFEEFVASMFSLEREIRELREEAWEEGYREGRFIGFIETVKGYGQSFDVTVALVASHFSLDEQSARDVVQKYWEPEEERN